MDVVRVAKAALETGPVCDACLGRCVADRSFGLTNRARGEALRTALALANDETREAVEPPSCWVCEGICGRYDSLAAAAVDAIGDREFATYQVGSRVPGFVEANDELLKADACDDEEAGETIGSEINREVGKRVGELTGSSVDFTRPDVLLVLDLERDDIEVTVNSAFVYGRYRKLERGIPQTRWPCSLCDGTGDRDNGVCAECDGSGYLYDRSVEQLIVPVIVEAMEGTSGTFHGAGREDVDARMLGRGRPFVVEVDRPARRRPELDPVSRTINDDVDGVEVRSLALVSHEMVEHVKELEATKTYEASVQFDAPVDRDRLEDALTTLEGATIVQRTPQRVSHRRSDLYRERTVFSCELIDHDSDTATISIHGEGGLYIKELLHGDQGRTDPNLARLLETEVAVESLDVVDVTAVGEDETFVPEAYRI